MEWLSFFLLIPKVSLYLGNWPFNCNMDYKYVSHFSLYLLTWPIYFFYVVRLVLFLLRL